MLHNALGNVVMPDGSSSPSRPRSAAVPLATSEARVAIELTAVGKRYRVGGADVDALADVTLTIAQGEFVVVLGASGSGKTTLLNIIGGLDTASAGRVIVEGRDLSRASRAELRAYRRHAVSFVFQTFNLFPSLTAEENVQFAIDLTGRGDTSARSVLDQVGLGARTGHFPGALSGGEQQRVAIARALATGNPIMLADEPTGELDYRTGVQILRLLQEQARAGRVVILVTHNREIARIADRVIQLGSGRVTSDGPPPGGRANVDELSW